jgi:hypothetical protein
MFAEAERVVSDQLKDWSSQLTFPSDLCLNYFASLFHVMFLARYFDVVSGHRLTHLPKT